MKTRERTNRKGVVLMLVSAFFVSVGQLFWKISAGSSILFLGAGFVCYGSGALIMLYAYRFGSLSVLQPLLCVSYVIAIFFGLFFLHESISLLKVSGVILIILGVVLVATGESQ
jgi:undecaprenyl phosphate-alpha-L-ara4N flippase subunit ArnE